MKKFSIFLLLGFMASLFMFQVNIHATQIQDDQLIDEVNKQNSSSSSTKTQELKENFKFQTFKSCDDLEKVLAKYATNYRQNYLDRPMMLEDTTAGAVNDMDSAKSVDLKATQEKDSSTTDFSTTNVQIGGVDEPEILKTDGKYLYYYNQQKKIVYVLQSPLNIATSKINLSNAKIIKEIKMPKEFNDVKLFLTKNRLAVIATRYSEGIAYNSILDRGTNTNVAVYDTTNMPNLKLVKLFNTYGYFKDARLIGDDIYLVSDISLRLYYAYNTTKVFGVLPNTTVDIQSYDVLPKSMDLTYTTDKSKQNISSKLPYTLGVNKIDCDDIFYVMPSEESLKKYNVSPSFSMVSKINIGDYNQKPQQQTMFGNAAELHMTDKSLYVSNNFYISYNYTCPMWARCIMPYYYAGENTLIHKFNLSSTKALEYKDSTIVSGLPLNQYSMSEDSQGYFRIITSNYYPQRSTGLYVLDSDLKLTGKLENIEPGEDFKSSRFIGDKLYMVTFQQVDPLFVIDIKDRKSPKIVGELKIPGYSTYLHPYAEESNGIQYLIGLGYDTVPTQWGGVANAGIKIDMYKIDYNTLQTPEQKCKIYATNADDSYTKCLAGFSGDENKKYISVDQIHTKTLGEKGSFTEALENPRMFVFDSKRKFLVMPAILQKEEKSKYCYFDTYQNKENCYDNYIYKTTFAGLKGFTLDTKAGIIESISKDYTSILTGAKDEYGSEVLTQWGFRNLQFRVGYLGDAIYGLNNYFGDFFILGDEKNSVKVDFQKVVNECLLDKPVCGSVQVQCIKAPCEPINETFKNKCELQKNNMASYLYDGACKVAASSSSSTADKSLCKYEKPAEGTVSCQMYCGKRWVQNSTNSCEEIEVSAACSCPGFDTKETCESTCK